MSHIHEWVEQAGVTIDSEAYRCAECELTSDLCHVCSGPSGSSLWICERCLEREQQVVRDVERYLDLWDERDRHREKSPAAMALVTVRSSGESGITAPEDVLSILWSWVARWTEYLGASGATPAEFLARHIIWAVHNPGLSDWEDGERIDFRREMRRARAAARSIVGLSPERMSQRCPRCSGVAVRDREAKPGVHFPDGLQDEVRCTGCGFVWRDEDAFMAAARTAVEHVAAMAPDAQVTMEQARKMFPEVPSATWRQWRHRQLLVARGGRYRAGDLHALVQRWEVERRGGERASERIIA